MDYLGSSGAARVDETARGVGFDAGAELESVGTGGGAVEGRRCGHQCDTRLWRCQAGSE
jgi:hypothetical protein